MRGAMRHSHRLFLLANARKDSIALISEHWHKVCYAGEYLRYGKIFNFPETET